MYTRCTSLTTVPQGTCTITSRPRPPASPWPLASPPFTPLNTNLFMFRSSSAEAARMMTSPPSPPAAPTRRLYSGLDPVAAMACTPRPPCPPSTCSLTRSVNLRRFGAPPLLENARRGAGGTHTLGCMALAACSARRTAHCPAIVVRKSLSLILATPLLRHAMPFSWECTGLRKSQKHALEWDKTPPSKICGAGFTVPAHACTIVAQV